MGLNSRPRNPASSTARIAATIVGSCRPEVEIPAPTLLGLPAKKAYP